MSSRASLVILGLVAAAIVAIVILFYTRGPFGVWRQQMATGATYMKSLKDSDVPPWIERTKRFLAEWKPGLHPVGAYGLGRKRSRQQTNMMRCHLKARARMAVG